MRHPIRLDPVATATRQVRRQLSRGDAIALAVGMLLAVLAMSFFAWKMVERLTSDRSLVPVAPSTPTPPAPPAPKSRFAVGALR